MLLTSSSLIVAGPPDEISEADPYGPFEGRCGGKLLIIDRLSGEVSSEVALDSPPVWDGISHASGYLFIAMKDGNLACLKACNRE